MTHDGCVKCDDKRRAVSGAKNSLKSFRPTATVYVAHKSVRYPSHGTPARDRHGFPTYFLHRTRSAHAVHEVHNFFLSISHKLPVNGCHRPPGLEIRYHACFLTCVQDRKDHQPPADGKVRAHAKDRSVSTTRRVAMKRREKKVPTDTVREQTMLFESTADFPSHC